MYIKEICLEGFKSYATRTVVAGFDPFFNAITGLNGSGKSNILDSICFVLGITNLQQVRASNLQELVYKQGQAGITKATVSVVFQNSDSNRSPLGYEDHSEITVTRQIVVGGRNKYLINGRVAQPKQVQNLFHSVQLNVNNPHFLIMQGRITKVLNMKPPEILSMLEEAAGTRMYETKKEDALKTLEKKQGKVDEIDRLLNGEIRPSLEKLRKEKRQYMEWANNNAELDRLRRFCVAFDFVQAERIRDSAVNGVEQIMASITQIDTDMKSMKLNVQDMETSISNLTAEKDAILGGEVKTLSEKVDILSCDLVKATSILKNQEDSLSAEKANAEKHAKGIEDIKRSIELRDSAVRKAEDGAADLKKRFSDLSKNLEEYEKEYQGVLAGKSSGNEDKCMEEQLADAKAAVGTAETELKQLKTKITHCEKELVEKRQQLVTKGAEAVAVENELRNYRSDLEKIKMALESVSYNEGQMEALQKDRQVELEVVQKLRDETRILSGQSARAQFTYRDPVKDFDRSKVKGMIAKLVKVKDSSTLTALEVTAGGKLYNVVVDNENTGAQLIEKGGLRNRVTIVPLNKIQHNVLHADVQQDAVKMVGDGNGDIALSLIVYDEEVKAAVEHVFGSTFICRTSDAAKEVTEKCKISCVTLQGDIFRQNGLVTGGHRKQDQELLRILHALAESESKLSFHEKRLLDIENKISQLQPLQKKFMDLKSQLELKTYELSLFQSRAEQNEHHKLAELVKKIEQELDEAKHSIKEKQLLYDQCLSTVSLLGNSIKEHTNKRESRLNDLDKKIKATKVMMQSSSKDLKEYENEIERLIMEKEAVIQEHASLESQLAELETQISSLAVDVDRHRAKVNSINHDLDQAQSELNLVGAKMRECDSEISGIVKEQQNLQQKLSEANLERKKLENEVLCCHEFPDKSIAVSFFLLIFNFLLQVKRMEIEQKDCSLKVAKLLEKHSWIAAEKQLLGKSGTDYDFSSCNPHKSREELEKLQADQSNLEKRVNKKVISLSEKAEDEYNDLVAKKTIIENDKLKIKMVIEELDEKKKETLKVTWVKVTKDFGSIFSTLLPGTMAKLEPPEGCNFLDGLEVRVAFGSVWKQSLSELSGGQRSLLALSLILALLLFKPAPLYILDEVDAALDLSHTQNIGKMIKKGMFNNANVLFRTKFVDGVSTVQRTVAPKQK
ncbi:hypothetical protein MKW92_003399 [Papaver armeniacum]|nr:hypothetical protein MKW92_003399 [Papaver armeniacum]